MHEVAIMQSIVDIAGKYAGKSGAQRITKIVVSVGSLSGVVPEALQFCFEICTKGTVLEGAELEIERVGSRGLCRDCNMEFDLLEYEFCCPHCNNAVWEIVSGKDLFLKELEVI